MFRIMKVTGESLSPFLMPGDFVLIGRLPRRLFPLRPGNIVVMRHPAYGTLIKRIESIADGGEAVFVVGDHPDSIDSRTFGAVRTSSVDGVVLKVFRQMHRES